MTDELRKRENFMNCQRCGARNSNEGLKDRRGLCYRCKADISQGVEVNVRVLRTMLNNNEIGQTISTIELLARHGSDTLALQNVRTELLLEQKSRRLEEGIHKAKEDRERIVQQFTDWFDLSVVYDACIDALLESDQAPTFEALKDLWENCCYDICYWVKGSVKEV